MSPIPAHNTAVNIEEVTGSHTLKDRCFTHSHQCTRATFNLPSAPRQPALSEMFPGSQQPETSSGDRAVVLTSPNPAWQPLINELLEAVGSWINAKKHRPKETCTEILQSRRVLREKWRC